MSKENSFDKKHYGFTKGIVIQNNDSERRGRIKIATSEFVSQFARSKKLPAETYAARFVGGDNINTIFSAEVLSEFCKWLPWAEQAAPLIGGGTAGVFDAKNTKATVGEGHRGTVSETLGEESITPSGESVSPKAAISIHGVQGGFDQGYRTGMCDVYNNSYAPTAINNATKGMFSVPRVGSQVWLFFDHGSLHHPVYVAYVYDKQDWNSVVNPQGSNPSLHYPAGAENIQDNEPYFFTGQTVLNTKAGSLEFTETDDFEKIKISHYSGSYYEIGNHNTVEINVENKATVTNINEHHTIKGDSAFICGGDRHEVYRGDFHITYGDPDNKSLYDDWIETAQPAFAHAAQFSQKERVIKDPTKDGASKGGPNKTFNHPAKLTLVREWTSWLEGMNPSEYMKKIQHVEIGLT
jgi:hypothetical protein